MYIWETLSNHSNSWIHKAFPKSSYLSIPRNCGLVVTSVIVIQYCHPKTEYFPKLPYNDCMLIVSTSTSSFFFQFDNTQEKIEDIDSYVHSAISPTCECSFPRGNVLGGAFTCLAEPDVVVYRSEIRGSDAGNCENLVSFLQQSIQSQTNPSVFVDGNLLELTADCDFSVSSINSEGVQCAVTVTSEALAESEGNVTVIAGGVAAGAVAVVLLILTLLVVCVVLRRKNLKRWVPVVLQPRYRRGGPARGVPLLNIHAQQIIALDLLSSMNFSILIK